MIHIDRRPPPDSLCGEESAGEKERAGATAFYGLRANKRAKYQFKAYSGRDVKQTLEQMFNGKCAYCEGIYDQFHPVDVEHFRPKGGFVNGAKLEVPGYYWLASEWTNLLPSCIDCNRARCQEFEDAPPHLSGKANKFPLANDEYRARRPGEERLERALLLDPCRDKPEKHLVFDDDGHVDPARDGRGRLSSRGKASIEVYGLDRDAKIRARRRMTIFLRLQMHRIEDLAVLLEEHPDDPEIPRMIRESRRELAKFALPEEEFSQMCRQSIARFDQRMTA